MSLNWSVDITGFHNPYKNIFEVQWNCTFTWNKSEDDGSLYERWARAYISTLLSPSCMSINLQNCSPEHYVKGNKQVSLELVWKILLPLAFLLVLFLQVYPAKTQLWKIKATDKIIHLLLTLSLYWHASSEKCELKFFANLETPKKVRKNNAGCQQLLVTLLAGCFPTRFQG